MRADQAFEGCVHGVAEKTSALAELALDKMLDKIEKQGDFLPVPVLLATADMALKRLGYSAGKGPGATNNTINNYNFAAVNPELLAKARDRMRTVHGVTITEAEVLPSPETPALSQPATEMKEAS
jgi:hypothetical protein